MNELVSVVMPTYNASAFLVDSIESVLNQTYSNLELLITDDCSTDDKTLEILEHYSRKDPRVRVFHLEQNMGAGPARNKSIEEARGRYIAFCDSDDNWTPDKLEMQVRFMQETKTKATYSSYAIIDEEGQKKGIFIAPRKISYHGMLRDDKMGFSTCIYDVEATGRKFFMRPLRKRQDWAMVIELMRHIRVAYGLKEPLTYYRIRKSSISRNKFSLVKYNTKVYQEVLGYSTIKSYLFFGAVFMPTYMAKIIKKKADSYRYLRQ